MTTTDTNYLQCITMAVFNTASLTGSYAALNGTGFSDDIKVLKVINLGTNGITVSLNGSTDHDFYPPGGYFVLDMQANHTTESPYASGTWRGKKGQIIYGKGTAGTGNLYIIGYR